MLNALLKARGRLNAFLADRRGAIAIIFALCVLPLLLVIGFAVDFRSLQTSRSDMQNALDSALLAAARTYTFNPTLSDSAREALAESAGRALWESNLADAGPEIFSPRIEFTFNSDEKMVQAQGFADAPLKFGPLAGVNMVEISVDGEARGADRRRVEIVLALDNTGSMFTSGRFNLMRSAAKNFVNTLYDQQMGLDDMADNRLYVGVVPWTTTVSINMERPDSDWEPDPFAAPNVGFDGTREVPPVPFQDFRQYLTFPNDHNLVPAGMAGLPVIPANYTQFNALFSPVQWRGCVRAAPGERLMAGTTVLSPLNDQFLPGMRWPAGAVEPLFKRHTSGNANGTLKCGNSGGNSQDDGTYNGYWDSGTRACRVSTTATSNTTRAACVSDAYEFQYLATNAQCPWRNVGYPRTSNTQMFGPNVHCPSAMLGLTGNRAQVLRALNRMYPGSDGTHADLGVMWGLRMLSPNSEWKAFFGHTGPNAPRDYDVNETRKVIILLTDGENVTPSKWEGYYGCVASTAARNSGPAAATPAGARECSPYVGTGTMSNPKLDALLRDSCNAVRNTYNIEVYTIAVDVTNASAITLLRQCAGDPARAHNITAAEINETFLEIANEMLRITD